MLIDPEHLAAEWLRLPDLPRAERDSLAVGWAAAQLSGGLAATTVTTTGMTWAPSESGVPHIIVPVWAGAVPSIFRAVEYPVVIDMVSFVAANPGRWFWRTRQAFALGLDQFDMARATAAPITIHPDPLSWLRAGCTGCVLLDYPLEQTA